MPGADRVGDDAGVRRVARRAAVAGGALGFASGWNIANVGALADPLAGAYGVPLVTIGLLTTVLFAVHGAVQIPGGRIVDRIGAGRAGWLTVAALACANAALLVSPIAALALAARAVAGVGSGLAFVAGSSYVREAGGGILGQGVFGSLGVAGSGCALAVVPALESPLGWRAPFATALAVAVLAALAVGRASAPAPTARLSRPGVPIARVLTSRALWLLGACHAASFGVSTVVANWVGSVLARQGLSIAAGAAAGAAMLVAMAAGRLLGGWLARRGGVAVSGLVARSLVAAGAGVALIPLVGASPLAFALAAAAGLAAGIAFGPTIAAAGRVHGSAPAAGVGLVNTVAALAVVVATPLVGLTVELPGDGAIGFALLGLLTAATALLVGPALGSAAAEPAGEIGSGG